MSKELQQTKDAVREIKSTLGKQLKEVRAEMQEELSALKSTLHTKDKLINSLKEKLNSVPALKETSPEPEILMNTPQAEQLAMKRESHNSTDPANQIDMSAAEDPRETQAFILIDSNGKYVNEKLLFPNMMAQKIWCPKTKSAFQVLSDRNLNENYKHIIINLRAMWLLC